MSFRAAGAARVHYSEWMGYGAEQTMTKCKLIKLVISEKATAEQTFAQLVSTV